MSPRYVFVVNPFSGGGKGGVIVRMLHNILPGHPEFGGGATQVFLTNQLDTADLRENLACAEVVVAVGGDGTVNHLLAHILGCSPSPALGLIPLGTSNDLARAVGLSVRRDYTSEPGLRKALDRLLSAKTVEVDVLSVNNEALFCNYFSIGLDAAIVRDFDSLRDSRRVKSLPQGRWTNNVLYFLMGLKNAGFYLHPPIGIVCGGEQGERVRINTKIRAIIVSNLPVYAGGCRISPDARISDGLFEIAVVRKAVHFLVLIGTRFLPFLRLPEGADRYRVNSATIDLGSPAPFQIDGEKCLDLVGDATCLKISPCGKLRVLTPADPM